MRKRIFFLIFLCLVFLWGLVGLATIGFADSPPATPVWGGPNLGGDANASPGSLVMPLFGGAERMKERSKSGKTKSNAPIFGGAEQTGLVRSPEGNTLSVPVFGGDKKVKQKRGVP